MKPSQINHASKSAQLQSGFTLIETTVASLILMVGLLSIAQVFALAALYNQSSKQTTIATSLAHRKMEQLLGVPLDSNLVQLGGSLTANQANSANSANYWENYQVDPTTKQMTMVADDQPYNYIVRWQIQADNVNPPMNGLIRITVRAEAVKAGLTGLGVVSPYSAETEAAEISTIRTPSQGL
jgi:hypothetical protein